MAMCFTDLSQTAQWRTTILDPQHMPWATAPNYSQLLGFDLGMVVCDLLHAWNLGVLRDAVGSILKVLVKETFVFEGHDIDARFQSATNLLKEFAKTSRNSLKLKRLSKTKLKWSNKSYPEFQGSGTDCHIVASFLESILEGHHARYGDFATLLWSGNKAMRLLYESPNWFLDSNEKKTFGVLGRIFLHTFLRLANEAMQRHEMLFKVRPKFHLVTHVVESPRALNFSRYATWMDEDCGFVRSVIQ